MPQPTSTSMGLRVLILSQHYWPETFRINEVAQSLIEAGCDVSVLTGQPNYPDGVVFPGYRAMDWGVERHPSGYDIYRVPLAPRGQGGALRLVINYLSFIFAGSLWGPWLLRRRRIDVVLVYGTSPILQALVGMVLRMTHRACLVTWIQDLWPQSLEVTGYVRNRHALAAIAALVRWIYRHNDALLVQSDAFLSSVRSMAKETPVEVHLNPGERAFNNVTPDSQVPALSLPEGFNVVFAGNLGTVQALDTVLEAARLLRPHESIRLVLIGSGARSNWLHEQVKNQALGNVLLPGRFAPEHMPGILSQASALLVSLARSDIMAQTVPSKVQVYLASGRPIIASMDGEGSRVIEESGAGVTCPAEDAQALAAAILALSRTPAERLAAMGAAGTRYYAKHFQPEQLAQQLRDRLVALTQKSGPADVSA